MNKPKTCEECWRFVAIECDSDKSAHGACDIDMDEAFSGKEES